MQMKKFSRALAMILAVMCLLSATALASTVYVVEDAKVYSGIDSSATVYGTLSAGTKVNVTAHNDTWARLEADGKVGYVKTSTLAAAKKYNGDTVYTAESAKLMSNFDGKTVATLPAGEAVKLYATAGKWALVKYGSTNGLMYTSSLTTKKPQTVTAAPQTVQTVQTAQTVTAYVKNDGAKAYQSNSTSSKVLAKLSVNDTVNVFAVKGDWCGVEKNGSVGCMRKSDLSTKKVDVVVRETFTAYAAKDGVKVYSHYSTSSDVVKTLNVNDTVTVLAYNSTWAVLKASKGYVYAKIADLSRTKIDTNPIVYDNFTVYAAKDGVKVYSSNSTSSSVVKTLNTNDTLSGVAYNNDWVAVKNGSGYAFAQVSQLSLSKIKVPNGSSTTPATGTAKKMDWWTSDIQKIFTKGMTVTITDVETGIAWKEKRVGGSSHADCQPVSSEDTAAMKKACGSWSWDRRAVFVTINGVNYAASINCMPHGGDSIPNNGFDGHHCVHFTNSRTHGGDSVCPKHQAAIEKAAKAHLK